MYTHDCFYIKFEKCPFILLYIIKYFSLLFDDKTSTKDEPLPEYSMALPDGDLFKDLHADHLQNFPNITIERVLDFLASCDKTYAKKFELLYEQRYVVLMQNVINDTIG